MNENQILMAVEELEHAYHLITDAKQKLAENGIDTLSYEVRDGDTLAVHVFCGLEELWNYFGTDTYEEKKISFTEKGFSTLGNVQFFAITDSNGSYRKAKST